MLCFVSWLVYVTPIWCFIHSFGNYFTILRFFPFLFSWRVRLAVDVPAIGAGCCHSSIYDGINAIFFSFCFTTPSGCAFSVRFINAESEIGASGSSSGWLSFFRYLAPTTLQKTWICFPPAGCLITPQTGLSCFDRATDLAEGKLWMPNLLNDGIDCCR